MDLDPPPPECVGNREGTSEVTQRLAYMGDD
jgi:hypothetical protein